MFRVEIATYARSIESFIRMKHRCLALSLFDRHFSKDFWSPIFTDSMVLINVCVLGFVQMY